MVRVAQEVVRADAIVTPVPSRRSTSWLLGCGVLVGPLFVTVIVIEILTRTGFDLRRNGISQLSLGERGWIQIANFVIAGLLTVAFAIGARRVLRPGPGATVAPLGIVGYGCGLVATGLFLVDPGVGFPPGTPEGFSEMSWHGLVHAAAPPISFLLLVGVCGVFARRSAIRRQRGLAIYCLATGIAALALICWPGAGGSLRSAAAVLVTSVWMTVVAGTLLRETEERTEVLATTSADFTD